MKLKQPFWLAAFFAAMMLLLPSFTLAQSIVTGAVGGVVTDTSGAVIAGATATLKSSDTGATLSTTTNSTGTYQFSLLKPGNYSLTVAEKGFKQEVISVEVSLGQSAIFNVKLEVGAASETVTVTEQGALLQTENANISTTVSQLQIENLPNPGGDLSNIAQTAPGVTMNTGGSGYGNFSAFGLPGTANLFTINGNDYNDPFLNLNNSGASNLLLGSNEIQEVAVVSNAYTGQYGRQAGAQIDYATKSGGNGFHGDAVYFYNSNGMNAGDYFDGIGHEVNNQWAAAIGGPVIKDKLFFFVNTEGIRYVLASGAGPVSYPTTDFQNYVLSQVALQPTAGTALPFYQNIFNIYQNSTGYAAALANPQAGSCGNLPAAAVPSGECIGQVNKTSPNGNKEWLLSGRVDYNLGANDKIFGRFKIDRGSQPTYTDPINPAFNIASIQPQDEGQLNYTHVFSPNVVNNFVGSVLWYSALFASQNLSGAESVFPGLFSLSDIPINCLGEGCGFDPAFSLFPQGRNVTQWGLVDDVSVARGAHNFKMGVNFRRDDVSDYTASEGLLPAVVLSATNFSTDTFSGSGGQTDFLGQQFAVSGRQPLAFYSFGLYFQDEYRVNPRLKLTLALRADRNSGGACQSNCGAAPFAPFAQLNHDIDAPFNQITNAGTHSILPAVEKVVFQPRIGVAWSPVGDRTVIRAGIGVFSDLYPGTILDAYTTNFPEVTGFTFKAPSNFAFTDPNSATNGVVSCNTGFQSNYASGGNLASYNAANPNCVGQLPNLNSVGKLLNPKYIEWNVEVQHTFGTSTVVSANYVGNRGYDELIFNPFLNGFDVNSFGGLPTAALDQRVNNVQELQNTASSNYNGLVLSVQQTLWKGFQARLNYTYSHALDDSSNGGVLPFAITGSQTSVQKQLDPFCLRCLNYGSADYDTRHNITANYLYAMPFHNENRIIDAALGGWVVSGTVYYHTGFPFSLVDGVNETNLGSENLGGAVLLAQPIAPVSRTCNSPTAPCFSSADFASGQNPAIVGPGCTAANPCSNPSPTGFGTTRRNSFTGPNYFNTDLSLRKNFRITERFGLTLGANAYNILNHPNFSAPFTNINNPANFGSIVQTVSPPTTPYGAFSGSLASARIVQLIAKMTF